MLDRCEVVLGAQPSYEIAEVLIGELCPIVRDKGLWNTEAGKDISFVKTKDVEGGDFGKCFGFYPFREVVYGHYEVLVLVRALREGTEYIHSPPAKGPQGCERRELVRWCDVHVGVALALIAFFDVFFGIPLHGGPIVAGTQGFAGKRPSSQVLSVNSFVDFMKDAGHPGLLDALEEGNGEASPIQTLLEDDVRACTAFGGGGLQLVSGQLPAREIVEHGGHPAICITNHIY